MSSGHPQVHPMCVVDRPLSLAVVICTYQREAVLVETLKQILNVSPPADEIIVVDQTPLHLPETHEFLDASQQNQQLNWVRQTQPSLCAARNQGVLSSSSDIILFLDDDVLIPKALVHRHKAIYLDTGIDAVTQDIATDESFDRQNAANADPSPEMHAREVDYLRGFNFSVRRSAFIAAQGFDEQFIGSVYRDEGDFAQRLMRCGRKIVADRRCNVVHLLTPAGGCRIPGNRSHAEWTKSTNFFLYGFRYGCLWTEFCCALRAGPLRRENVVHPLRWLPAIIGFVRGAFEGYRRAFTPVRSPFTESQRE